MEPDYNLIGTGIDLHQVDPISQKRLLAFFNFWLSQTVRLLNDCASQFETKLLDVDNRLRRLEASMTLLEAKLSSIPGLDVGQSAPRPAAAIAVQKTANDQVQRHDEKEIASATKTESAIADVGQKETVSADKSISENQSEAIEEAKEDISKDPQYAKYFKMLQLGVPEQAVKQKMEMEGVDSSVLFKNFSAGKQTAAASSATKGAKENKEKDDDSNESAFGDSDESSFSD